MNRPSYRLVAMLLTMLAAATGCHPTQPFYLHEDGDLSHYLATATEMETPDIEQVSLEEVTQARAPLTLSDLEFTQFRDLTLEECVTYALQNSKVIRNLGSLTQFTIADGLVGRTAGSTTVYDPSIFETDPQFGVEAALSAFDAQFTTGAFWEKTDRPQNSNFVGQNIFNNEFRRDLGQFDAGITKRSASGTTYAVRHQTIYDMNNNPSRGIPSDWYTAMDLEVTQPLLGGRGAQVNRAPVIFARTRVDIALADFEAAVRNMLQDLENSYWDLHFAYRFLETAKVGRDSALITWQVQDAKAVGGLLTAQEEAQSREQYFFFRAQMETALRDLLAAENRVRWLMGWSPTDNDLLRPVDRPTVARVQFEWQSSHAESLVRSAELRRQRWQVKQAETDMIIARNNLLPQLDLVGRYRWLGMGDQLIGSPRRGLNFIDQNGQPQEGSYAWDELTEGRYQEVRFGVQFTPPPIGARREHAGVRNAQLSIARERARLEDMELNVTHLLTTSIQNVDYHYQNAQTHFNRWLAAEKEVEALAALVEGNKAGVDLLLDGQRRRASAQADFYRSIIEYNKGIAQVHFRKGSLLEFNNVKLAEGPWPKKAYWDAMGRARERDASYFLDYGSTRPRVISRGPVDQGGSGYQEGTMYQEGMEGMIEGFPSGGPGMEMEMPYEQIPTPAPGDGSSEFPMSAPMDLEPLEIGPGTIYDGPSLGANSSGPASIPMGQPQPGVQAQVGDEMVAHPVRQAQHVQPARTQ